MKMRKMMGTLLAASLLLTQSAVFAQEMSFSGPEEDIVAADAATADRASVIYATADETASGDGSSEASPVRLSDAFKNAAAGDEIILLPGTYECTSEYKVSASGYESAPIKLIGDGAVLDFSKHPNHAVLDADDDSYSKAAGITLRGSYWEIEGLTIEHAPGVGLQIEGSNNRIKDCRLAYNRDTGLQISGSPDDKYENWAHDNYVLNCTSHHNWDDFRPKYGEDADGFAAKIQLGAGNVFSGCIAYCNSDDGWDLYAKDKTHPNESCTIVNCMAFRNGYPAEDGSSTVNGDGNGFKLGSKDWAVPNRIMNCIAFENMAHGFTDNNNTAPIELVGCTAFDNNLGNTEGGISGKRNYQFEKEKDGEATGLLSVYSTTHKGKQKCSDGVKGAFSDNLNGTAENCVFYVDGSFLITDKTSLSSGAVSGTALDTDLNEGVFKDVNVPEVTADFDSLWRDEKGFLKLGDLFAVSDPAYTAMGAVLSGGESDYKSFTTPAKSSSDYNDVNISRYELKDKFIVFSEYQVNGGKFTSAEALTGPANPWYTVVVSSTMRLADSKGEEDLVLLTDPEGETYSPTKRLSPDGDPEVVNGKIAGRAVKFRAHGQTDLTVYAMAGNSGTLTVFKEDGSIYDSSQQYSLSKDKIKPYDFSISESGTYYIGIKNNNQSFIYAITQTDEGGEDDDKDSSSSSEQMSSSSSAAVKEDVRTRTIKAMEKGLGSLTENELPLKAPDAGAKKKVYQVDMAAAVSGNKTAEKEVHLTLAKGDKVTLVPYDKKTAKCEKDVSKCIAVNGKGVLSAKRPTEEAVFAYYQGEVKVILKVKVIEPKVTQIISEGGLPGSNPLSMQLAPDQPFDLILEAPLTVKFDTVRAKRGTITFDNEAFVDVNKSGELHISGRTGAACSAKIPFTVCGKKYNLKIKVK